MRLLGKLEDIVEAIFGDSGNRLTLKPPTLGADYTLTLPAADDTLVGKATTDTLTNKTIEVASNTVTTAASGNLTSTELNAALAELQSDVDSRLTAVVDDTTPQLGGDLDVNGNQIVNGADLLLHYHGTSSIYVGTRAGNETSTGAGLNTALGVDALNSLTTGNNNVAIGPNAATAMTTATRNIAIGENAMSSTTVTASRNVAVGGSSASSLVGTGNVAVGDQALFTNSHMAGSHNVAIGRDAMFSGASGAQNIGIGRSALFTATSSGNTGVGDQVLFSLTSGSGNVSVGKDSLFTVSTNSNSTAVGHSALNLATGGGNTAVGKSAGITLTTGTDNTFIGNGADTSLVSSTRSTAIGVGAISTVSNQIMLGTATENVTMPGNGTPAADKFAVGTDGLGNWLWTSLDISKDTSPQLGGDLDVQSFKITTSTPDGNIIILTNGTGAFRLSATGDARGDRAVDFQVIRTATSQVASGPISFIGGGLENTASGTGAGIVNGEDNTASGSFSFVGSGAHNVADGNRSVVCGGELNDVNGFAYTAICGGYNNAVQNSYGFVGGGVDNVAAALHSAILGGRGNRADHQASVALGAGARTSSNFDFVVGQVDTSTPSVANVYFRADGSNADVHIGRATNQAAVAGASNKLVLHTVNATNQVQSTSLSASPSQTVAYDMVLPPSVASAGQVLTDAAGDGILSWATPAGGGASGWSTSTVAGAGPHVVADDDEVFIDTSSAAAVITMPAAAKGTRIRFIDDQGSWAVNNVTVNGNGGDTFDGSAGPLTLNVSGSIIELIGDTGNWRVVVLK